MVVAGWVVLALVFLDELLAFAAAYVWGAHAVGWWLGVLPAVAAVVVWALVASPRARYGGPFVRPLTKVLILGLASLGLAAAGHPLAAALLLVFSLVVNAVAQVPTIRDLAGDPHQPAR